MGLRVYYSSSYYIRRLNLSSIIWGIIVVVIYYLLIRIVIVNYNEGTLFKNNITIKVWNYLSDVMNRGSIIRTFLIMTALYILSGLVLFFLSAWKNVNGRSAPVVLESRHLRMPDRNIWRINSLRC